MSKVTLKVKYTSNEKDMSLIKLYQRQYTSCFNVYYNRLLDGYSKSEVEKLQLNNIELLDSWFKRCCSYDAAGVLSSRKTLQFTLSKKHEKMKPQQIEKCKRNFEKRKLHPIFGSSKQFFKRQNHKISKEQFQNDRLHPIYSIGENCISSVKGNRKFSIQSDLQTIIFKPNKDTKIYLNLKGIGNRLYILKTLYLKQENNENKIKIHYKLDDEYIYITYESTDITYIDTPKIKNRILGIDMNPNYIGWSIVDWKSDSDFKVIKSGVFYLYNLNKQHNTNKKHFEIQQISKQLINIALYYKVYIFGIEDLSIKSKDHKKGKIFNRVVNQWIRNELINNLNKRCNIFGIKLLKVKPEYSSFIGNFLYRSLELGLPDMCLSSIEIGRRAYEFYNQYITKSKDIKKNCVYPDLNQFKYLYIKSLEEFGIGKVFKRVKDLYRFFKNPNNVRIPLRTKGLKVFCTDKSYIRQVIYI